jgi:putative membrane protein
VLELIPVALTAATLLGYGAGLNRLRRRRVSWPIERTGCLIAGSVCVAAAVLPPVAASDELFPVHISQHLLLGMAGPALFALSAPITLALRALPRRPRRRLLRLLHSRILRAVTAPATALLLDVGGLYLLYLTGLYARAEHNDSIHATVHLHMLLAGCLLSWAIIGVDPIPRRPSFAIRIVALIIAGAAHDTLTKLMYAHDLPAASGPVSDRHIGAELMYYGGTVIDVAIAVVLMAQWWRVSGRILARSTRRAGQGDRPATEPATAQLPRASSDEALSTTPATGTNAFRRGLLGGDPRAPRAPHG